MAALGAMQDKNTELENNLSAETRFKQDLFSALAEERRQIKILQSEDSLYLEIIVEYRKMNGNCM